jgi:membrane fusion protein (multidrug efflux system)
MARNFILIAPNKPSQRGIVDRFYLSIFISFCLFLFSCQNQSQQSQENGTKSNEGQENAQDQKQKGKGKGTEGKGKPEEVEAFPVELVSTTQKTMHLWLEQNALVESKDRASIKATSSGMIQAIQVEEGQSVKKGQVLLKIFQPTDKELLQKLQINLQKASLNEERLKKMSNQGLATQDEWQQAQFALQQAQLELKQYQSEKSNQIVKAPISGVIAQKLVFLGENVAIGQALFDIIDLTEILIPIKVPEKWSSLLQEKQRVKLFDRSGQMIYEHASIYRVAPMIDAQSGTIKIEIRLKQQEIPQLKIGTYLKAHLLLGTHENVMTVPKEVLVYQNDQVFVMIAVDQKAQRVPVELGYEEEGFVEIKSNPSVNEHTRLIRFGQQGLENGSPIRELKN